MTKVLATLCISALLTLPAQAADEQTGAAKAHLCTGCHGSDGMKAAPGAVPIGGRPVVALVSAMQDYRHLRRLNPAMQLLLLSMTDQDILDVAEYFARSGTVADPSAK